MGSFYTNYTLKGPSQKAVAEALAVRNSVVSPALDGCVVVFDEESEEQDREVCSRLASWLSEELRCPLIVFSNHDDDILWFQLYVDGGLVDEYDSTPDYFESAGDELPLPSGGNSQAIAAAFGAKSSSKIESILRKPSGETDGYVFAIERHGDLVNEIGLPSFGVGYGYELISGGQYPDGLDGAELITTSDLVSAGPALGTPARKPTPGFYKVRYSTGSTIAPTKATVPIGWMPELWEDQKCEEGSLSDEFHSATRSLRKAFNLIGFTEIGFKKACRLLNPDHLDDGAVYFWDSGRATIGQLLYSKFHHPALEHPTVTVVTAFVAVLGKTTLGCSNDPTGGLGPIPNQIKIKVSSEDPQEIHQAFLQAVAAQSESPQAFPDLASVAKWFDGTIITAFEERVRSGIFVPMTDFEVAVARTKRLASSAS